MYFRLFVVISFFYFFAAVAAPLKVLHLTFHRGCAQQVQAIAQNLSLDLTTWYVPDLPPRFFDGYAEGNALYNIGHTRAEKIWQLHSAFFHQFDLIFTSDTAALSRIFLQNNSPIPLIIWICNRFDYHDTSSLDCTFPDPEYYQLLKSARRLPHVAVIANTAFEHAYARFKGVDTGSLVIQPIGPITSKEGGDHPSHPARQEIFYLPHYHNEHLFIDLSQHLIQRGIPNYCGRHNGLGDLAEYKGIIHLPYSWSTIALFENIAMGIPYFIPSKAFLNQLLSRNNYWHQEADFLFNKKMIHLSEWYNEDHKHLFTYFDSWEDLVVKVDTCSYAQKREVIKKFANQHQQTILTKSH